MFWDNRDENNNLDMAQVLKRLVFDIEGLLVNKKVLVCKQCATASTLVPGAP